MRQKVRTATPPRPNAIQISGWFQEWRNIPRTRRNRRPVPTVEHCKAIAEYLSPENNSIDTHTLHEFILDDDVRAFDDLLNGRMREVLDQAGRLKNSLVGLKKFISNNGIPESEFDPKITTTLEAVESLVEHCAYGRSRGRPKNKNQLLKKRLQTLCEQALRQAGWPESVSGSGPDGPVNYVIDRILEHIGRS